MSGHTATPWAVDPDHRPGMGWNAHVVEAADPDNRVCFMTSGPEGKINAAFIVTACNSHAELVKALERCERLFKEALPKFDWGKSALDGNAIALLNEVPGEVRKALATLTARKVG